MTRRILTLAVAVLVTAAAIWLVLAAVVWLLFYPVRLVLSPLIGA